MRVRLEGAEVVFIAESSIESARQKGLWPIAGRLAEADFQDLAFTASIRALACRSDGMAYIPYSRQCHSRRRQIGQFLPFRRFTDTHGSYR